MKKDRVYTQLSVEFFFTFISFLCPAALHPYSLFTSNFNTRVELDDIWR